MKLNLRVPGVLGLVTVVMAGAVTLTAKPALAYAIAPCDPTVGVTAGDSALASSLNSQLGQKMRGQLTGYRVSCARTVVGTVRIRGIDARAATIAMTAVIVESSIDNIAEEIDHDSLGLFQQRASWGSRSQRLDVAWATNAFLNKMLQLYPDGSWRTRPVGEVCQAVQASAFPDRYQPQASDGAILAGALWNLGANAVAGGDVTGDGRLDLVARRPDGSLSLYTNTGNNSQPYGPNAMVGSDWQQFSWFLAGDVIQDGLADLVAERPDGTLLLYANSGNPNQRYSSGFRIGSDWNQFTNITLADVTGDRLADLVATRPDGTMRLYANTFDASQPYNGFQQIGDNWQQYDRVVGADVTGDGLADLVATRPDGTLWLYVNNGSSSAPYGMGRPIGSEWQQFNRVVAGDVNGDALADLVATRPDGVLLVYVNTGNTSQPFTTGTAIGSAWQQFI
jgi:DNA-directed RNA polymerase subunit N (RpoN/RPB10)